MKVVMYTDGSCLKNPGGAGGYCAIITCESNVTLHTKIVKGALNLLQIA